MSVEKIKKFSEIISPASKINEVIDNLNTTNTNLNELDLEVENLDFSEFSGATSSVAGQKGMVPAPSAGSDNRFLSSDATWKEIDVPTRLSELLNDLGLISANSPQLSGEPTAPTATKGTNTDQIATMKALLQALSDYTTTSNLNTELNKKANLASPTFTGTPKATTPSTSDNSTRIATTAFVQALLKTIDSSGIEDELLAQNGYVKFTNGLILQWGQYDHGSITSEINTTISFLINFPQFYSISAIMLRGDNGGNIAFASIGSFNGSNFRIQMYRIGSSGSRYIKWIAIGK